MQPMVKIKSEFIVKGEGRCEVQVQKQVKTQEFQN